MTDIRPLETEVAQTLAQALVASSNAPVLLLDANLMIVAASSSFCKAFRIDPAAVEGRSLISLGDGEWDVPQLRSLLKATIAGHADIPHYEMDLIRLAQPSRRLVLNAHALAYGVESDVRVLLTVANVTDARAAEKFKDDLLREKAILLQELQHRVANSLQIIASVLMMSARKVNSDETRRHLYDAHNRVMSVASLQKQLAASTVGDVRLAPYFRNLCDSISSSMIHDSDQLTLGVTADNSIASADISISLGLIITELVINALKHAFPGGRRGTIKVGYSGNESGWVLGVRDDGVGMPADSGSFKSGFGSSIVAALANQLAATIEVSDGNPGTNVTVTHPSTPVAAAPTRPV